MFIFNFSYSKGDNLPPNEAAPNPPSESENKTNEQQQQQQQYQY
jgi:hypothetical protein